jgi:hypothetical protein
MPESFEFLIKFPVLRTLIILLAPLRNLWTTVFSLRVGKSCFQGQCHKHRKKITFTYRKWTDFVFAQVFKKSFIILSLLNRNEDAFPFAGSAGVHLLQQVMSCQVSNCSLWEIFKIV